MITKYILMRQTFFKVTLSRMYAKKENLKVANNSLMRFIHHNLYKEKVSTVQITLNTFFTKL